MISGNAVPTTVWSSATRNSASMSPATASTVPLRPDCSIWVAFALICALSLIENLGFHCLGEKAQHPTQLLKLFLAQDAVYPAPELLVYLRQPVQNPGALLREIHPHHAIVVHVALPADQTVGLQRLRRAGHARRVQLVLLRELALAQPILPVQHREQEPLHAPDPRLTLYGRQHPLERQRERRQHRMDAPQNLFFAPAFYHRPSSDRRAIAQSLCPMFAVSTFASETIVRTFTGLRRSVVGGPTDRACGGRDGLFSPWIPAFAEKAAR